MKINKIESYVKEFSDVILYVDELEKDIVYKYEILIKNKNSYYIWIKRVARK
jgi:hypothetical protein